MNTALKLVGDAWDYVLRARTASASELRELAIRVTDAIEQEPVCSSLLMLRAVTQRLGRNLRLLADAAPPDRTGPLHRLSAVVDQQIEEQDDCYWDSLEYDDERLA